MCVCDATYARLGGVTCVYTMSHIHNWASHRLAPVRHPGKEASCIGQAGGCRPEAYHSEK